MDAKVPKTTKSPNKAHRPSKQQSIELDKKIRKYFEEGYSAYGVYLATGIEIKTINARYTKWLDEYEDKSDFIQRQIDAKTAYLNKMEYARKIHVEFYDFVAAEIKEKEESKKKPTKKTMKKLYSERSSILNMINHVDKEILEISTKPLIKDKLEEYIAEKIDQRAQEVVVVSPPQ